MKGQAVVEMALVTPILLLLILGMLQVGLAMTTSLRLHHAAQQGASAGAAEDAVPRRCDTALAAVRTVYGSTPSSAQCSQPGNVIELRLVDSAPPVGPWGVWDISAIGRAVRS